jgi:small-conductance mechanosensitive channel
MGIPLFTSAPPLAKGFAALLLVAPVLWLLTPVLERDMRRGLYGLALWYVVAWNRGFMVLEPLSIRIVMLLEGLAMISVLVWLLRPARLAKLEEPSSLLHVTGVAVRLTLLALAAAVVSNVLGNTSLAELLTDATLASAYVGFLLFAVERVLVGGYAGLLHTQLASSLRVVRTHSPLLRRRGVRLIRFATVALWIFLVLGFFRVREQVTAGIRSALTTPWSIGNLELALGDFVAFGVMIWLSFLLSRFVRFTLEEELLPRTSLPRGVPFAISALARYTILLFGFLIAIAAAGIDMSRITLIIGALGVGIGIGLQGVVNNIVSGLILLFERPIQVGDTVQLGDTLGEVRRIGIRSSTLRTFDGAEVVIPNARFVSDEFVNWTLSDRNRRIEISVGVAYGSDPERVIALLLDVANSHPEVMSNPAPTALFLRFGESSLDFQLRAWTGRSETWREVSSQLAIAINRALAEAGIVIPFPQRDLHLRSVDPRLQKDGAGG